MIRVTIACPEALVADANELARVLGYSAADGETYGAARWRDAGGNRYAVASGLVSEGFAAAAQSALAEPEWGADMAAAARAQMLITIGGPADPARLVAVFGEDAEAAYGLLGVVSDTG
ncbi:hypothetical protein [Bosea sp. (in: a-proteobacteria)]|uniref:hypothetical protein n=1 Tax=Bosea sp. (in: a-proteobacteria) TaxID=1871050 RepID=UPI0026368CD7|nr:hypothetical protein [Bosea sp. (in: a-proteobacteria)]MCO5092011.1 hypothetical protein [Bosea sp. (in: a-proteobacteria)]